MSGGDTVMGRVRHLTLDASNVTILADNHGLLAAPNNGLRPQDGAKGVIEGCHVIGTVTGTNTGGIVGVGSNEAGSVIVGCSIRPPEGTPVCVRGTNAGGIAGSIQHTGVWYCVCHGNVDNASDGCGGVVSTAFGTGQVLGCVMAGDVAGGTMGGGIVGATIGSGQLIDGCVMHGAVTGDGNGGLCGGWAGIGTISNSYTTGATGADCGALVGNVAAQATTRLTVAQCYAAGTVDDAAATVHTVQEDGTLTLSEVHAADVDNPIQAGSSSDVLGALTLLDSSTPGLWTGFEANRWLAVAGEPPLLRAFQNSRRLVIEGLNLYATE